MHARRGCCFFFNDDSSNVLECFFRELANVRAARRMRVDSYKITIRKRGFIAAELWLKLSTPSNLIYRSRVCRRYRRYRRVPSSKNRRDRSSLAMNSFRMIGARNIQRIDEAHWKRRRQISRRNCFVSFGWDDLRASNVFLCIIKIHCFILVSYFALGIFSYAGELFSLASLEVFEI